jgi:sodium-dependent dicarboxylate transporter 2/3/5
MSRDAVALETEPAVVQRIGLVLGPLLFLIVLFFGDLGDVTITRTAAIALWIATWWITDAIPLAATALLPIVLFPLLGVQSGAAVAEAYANWIIFLYIGGFLVATAMQRWNLHRRIALRILLSVGASPPAILFGFMAGTAFLSMWISNTATTMMMVPIALAILANLDEIAGRERVLAFGRGVLLGIPYAASIGGISTLVGTPPNMSLVGIYATQFPEHPSIDFLRWMLFALPLALVMFAFAWAMLAWRMKRTGGATLNVDISVIRGEYARLGPMGIEERIVLAIFAGLAVAWITRDSIALPSFTLPGWILLLPEESRGFLNDGVVAIAFASLLFIIPSVTRRGERLLEGDAFGKLPWGIVLLFGGGFALAGAFQESGLSLWVGERLGLLAGWHPIVIIFAVCFVITFLTEVTSNTASAQILLPVLAGLALEIDVHPLLLMVPGAVSCSCAFMLPVATPPNAIAFSSDRLRMRDMVRAGLALNLFGAVVVTLFVYFWGRQVFGI